jgi:hypothetical protein
MIRVVLAGVLLVLGLAAWRGERTPQPTPAPGGELELRGKFVGPEASEDAATTAALCEEIASEIEWDSMQAEPFYTAGIHFDTLRTRARQLRCRGVSLGEKHPRARDAVEAYLVEKLGKSGGPVSPEQRAAWIAAYREIARAAADAAR